MSYLALNTGSSTLKFKLFDSAEKELASGNMKNYDEKEYQLEYKIRDDETKKIALKQKDFDYSIDYLFNFFIENKLIGHEAEFDFVVHRIVHGGEEFTQPAILNDENIKKIEKYNDFAPLHNPFALAKVKQIAHDFPEIKQYAVFDTSFNLSVAKEDFLYGLPYGYYENLKVRRFGFHGISHQFVTNVILKLAEGSIKNSPHPPLSSRRRSLWERRGMQEEENLNKIPDHPAYRQAGVGDDNRIENIKPQTSNFKLISCHLGSGSSVCAILNGKAVDNSFGFSTNENLIMATRSGEVDYDAMMFLKKKLGMSDEEAETLLNTESGLLGISGYTKDMKQLLKDYDSNPRAKLAIDMYVNAIVKYISIFFVKLGGCDFLTFTAGIGAGSDVIRKMICDKLNILGIEIDDSKNNGVIDASVDTELTGKNSKTQIWIIPTDEEKEMVMQIKDLRLKTKD